MLEQNNKKLLEDVCDIWGKNEVSKRLNVDHKTVGNWLLLKNGPRLDSFQIHVLNGLLPDKPESKSKRSFTFIDLFAGIGV